MHTSNKNVPDLRTARWAAHKNLSPSQNSPIDPKLIAEDSP